MNFYLFFNQGELLCQKCNNFQKNARLRKLNISECMDVESVMSVDSNLSFPEKHLKSKIKKTRMMTRNRYNLRKTPKFHYITESEACHSSSDNPTDSSVNVIGEFLNMDTEPRIRITRLKTRVTSNNEVEL